MRSRPLTFGFRRGSPPATRSRSPRPSSGARARDREAHGACTATTGRAQRFELTVFVRQATAKLPNGTITIEPAVRLASATTLCQGRRGRGTGAYAGAREKFTSSGDPPVDTYALPA